MLNFEHKRTNDDQQGEELIPKERKRIEKEIIFYRKRKERKCQKEKTSRQKPKPSQAEPSREPTAVMIKFTPSQSKYYLSNSYQRKVSSK